MSHRTYRLTTLCRRIDAAIRHEMTCDAPSALRLLRLKMIRIGVSRRLREPMAAVS